MRYGPSLRGFVVGVLVGSVIGSVGVAGATFGLKGWSRFSEDFRNGYVNGFLDMANLARNLEPGGWVDKRYPYLPAVKPQEWRGVIDKIYTEPANKDYLITSMMQLAGKRLEDRYGKAEDPLLRQKRRTDAQMEALRKKLSQGAKLNPATPPPAAKPDEAAKPAGEKPASGAVEVPVPPRPRKWCRCDGTDPKAAREKRKAEAAAEESRSDAEMDRAAGIAPAKTPPNAPPAKPAKAAEPAKAAPAAK